MRIAAILTGALLLLPAQAAFAHARLVRADPAAGSETATGPKRIWLKFNQYVRVPPTAVRLTWPDGHRLVIKALRRDPGDPDAVAAPLPAPLGPGRYRLEWRALSADGHSTQGTFRFVVKG